MSCFYSSIISIFTILIGVGGLRYPVQTAPFPSNVNARAVRTASTSITFNDSGPDLMILGNSYLGSSLSQNQRFHRLSHRSHGRRATLVRLA